MASKAKHSNWIVENLKTVFWALLIAGVFRTVFFQPFWIPSGSMKQTLLIGDFLFVNKFAYGLRLPVTHTRILETGTPQRGDVAVFRYPVDDRTDFIKRIVAVPGDVVAYRNKTLYINGQPQPVTPIGRYQGVGAGAVENNDLHAIENLMGVEHEILIDERYPDYNPQCRTLADGPIMVPDGQYFAMGDNRDSSIDSRVPASTGFGVGYVPTVNLVGRAEVIFFSTNGRARLWEVWKWPQAIRYGRLLDGIG